MKEPPGATRPQTPLLTRRVSLECLAFLACAPFGFAASAQGADTLATTELERAHAALAGDEALALGRQVAALLGRDAARALLAAESNRFANAWHEDSGIDARRVLNRLAAEDFRANRVLELRGLWLPHVEVALLVAPILRDPVASDG